MRFIYLVLLLLLGANGVRAETLVIAGTGDSQNLLRRLAPTFESQHPGVTVKIPDSIGSRGGIRAVTAGQADLGRTSQPLQPSEATGLVEYRFAISPIIFVAHPSVERVTNITSAQIVDIYAGRIDNWSQLNGPRHRLYAVDREQGDSSRSVLESKLAGFAVLKSTAKIFFSTPETVEALVHNPYAFGYLPLPEVAQTDIKQLSVEGVNASTENVISGRYPYTTDFYIVSKGGAVGSAQAFINFLYSEPAKKIMRELGAVPVDK